MLFDSQTHLPPEPHLFGNYASGVREALPADERAANQTAELGDAELMTGSVSSVNSVECSANRSDVFLTASIHSTDSTHTVYSDSI